MPSHIQISVTTEPKHIETLSDIFFEYGADAVTMTDAKDEPLFQLSPEDNPHWQLTTVQALFDESIQAENIIEEIKKNYPEYGDLDFYIERIMPKNWVAETQKQFQPQQFGDCLWVCPQWEKDAFKKSGRDKKNPVIFIEPGLAFGTGTHPTTQLCLTWIATHSLKNKTVIDYGCGSGILALGALAVGAKTVWATDHDPQALESTHANAAYNQFDHAFHIVSTDAIASARAEVVIANILANPLITLASTLTELTAPKGTLVLSGILANDAQRVAAAYQEHFAQTHLEKQGEWVLIEFRKI